MKIRHSLSLVCALALSALAAGCQTHPPLSPEAQSVADSCQTQWDSEAIDPIRHKLPPPWAFPNPQAASEWTKPTPEDTNALIAYQDLTSTCLRAMQGLALQSPGNVKALAAINAAREKLLKDLVAGRLAYADYSARNVMISQKGARYFLAHLDEEGSKYLAAQMIRMSSPPLPPGRKLNAPPPPVEKQGLCSHDGILEQCQP